MEKFTENLKSGMNPELPQLCKADSKAEKIHQQSRGYL